MDLHPPNVSVMKHGPSPGQGLMDFCHGDYSESAYWKSACAKAFVSGFEMLLLVPYCVPFLSLLLLYFGSPPTISFGMFFLWGICESLFFLWSSFWVASLKERRPMPPLSANERLYLAKKIREQYSEEEIASSWAKQPGASHKATQLREWLIWAFFDRGNNSQLDKQETQAILGLFDQANLGTSAALSPGALYRPTLDPLVYKTKPLIFYAIYKVVKHVLEATSLSKLGFQKSDSAISSAGEICLLIMQQPLP